MFERIVVGVTKESTAREAAAAARQLALTLGAELHVVTAFDEKATDGSADRAEQLLGDVAMGSGKSMQLHSRPGDPAAAICDVAREVGADLIVIGNKGLAGSGRWSASVPGTVTRTAPCAVLLLDTV
jgi:nucleotide-binding universal stress UspA family protein